MATEQPLITPAERAQLLLAAEALDNIEARGFVDFSDESGGYGVEHVADILRGFVSTLTGGAEAAGLRLV